MADVINKFSIRDGEAYTTVLGKKIYTVMDEEAGKWTKPVVKIPALSVPVADLGKVIQSLEVAIQQAGLLQTLLAGKDTGHREEENA